MKKNNLNENKYNTLTYENYDNIDVNIEKEKIINASVINLKVEPTNKKFLFLLGMIFAAGKKINITNEEELDLTSVSKSFSIMPYVWSKLSDDNFPNKDFSNVNTELLKRIEKLKKLGVKESAIESEPIPKKLFLICPVRNATETQKQEMEIYISQLMQDGYKIHVPHLNTVQSDVFGGYSICNQNANAIASSEEIQIYYDNKSTGSVFDLGVSYFLNKPIKILNDKDIVLDENDFIEKIILNWNKKEKELIKK